MKKLFFKHNIAIASMCVVAVLSCTGCAVTPRLDGRVIAYVSSDSAVYGTVSEVVRQVADSVVEISTESITTQWGMQYVVSGAGSGVIVARESDYSKYYIVTNNHVIAGARNISVRLRSGGNYSATLVATDERGDIAVISISESATLNIASWGNSTDLHVGEDLIAIGNPLGNLGGTVTKGILSATERNIAVGNYTMTLLQTDTAINPGNSGGGLFNMRGELVGVVNAKTSDEEIEGICFAIPANTARAIFTDLVTNGVVIGRVTLGIEVAVSNNILYVTDAGGAAEGTFKKYDKIASINGKSVTSLLSYNDVLATIKPNDSVTVTVYRGSLQQTMFGSTVSFATDPTEFVVTAKQIER